MSSPAATPPIPELHPNDMANLPPGVSLANVPAFEQSIAAHLALARGSNPNDIAHTGTTPWNANKIYVDDPSAMSQPVLNHEVMHKVQQQAGNVKSVGEDPNYNYGDPAEIKSVSSLDSEKQAQIVQDYTDQMQHMASHPVTQQTLVQADQLNTSYARSIRQLAGMAETGSGINTNPAPPGPPPAVLTGMIKPLPEIGGRTIELHRDDLANHPGKKEKGKK